MQNHSLTSGQSKMGSSLNPSPYVLEKLSHEVGKKNIFFPLFIWSVPIDVNTAIKQILLQNHSLTSGQSKIGSCLNSSPYVFEKLSHEVDKKKKFFKLSIGSVPIDVNTLPKQILCRITAWLVVNPKWVVA